MAQTFEDSIPAFVDKMAKLSMEDVALTKNRDKFIQEEIKEKVNVGNRLLEDSEYNTSYFNKAIKQRRRELAEAANPLGARTGRMPMKEGGFPDLTGDGKVTQADILKGRGVFQKGGDVKNQMEMMLGTEEEMPMIPDEQMEEDYVDYVIEETLSNQDRNYLIDALEKDDRLSEIFDQVVESATEFTGSGTVEGPGTGKSDSIPARLSDGEFVFTAKATEEIGADNLMRMMKDAEAAVDERQQLANGGSPMAREEEVMVAPQEPIQQNINVTKTTLDSASVMPMQDEDSVSKTVKENMMLDPYQRHVRS
jgi:hypothetical protein